MYSMKAEKSHNQLSASWRPRKAGGAIQSEPKGLRTRGADNVNPNLRAKRDEMRCCSSTSDAGKQGQILFLPFILFRPSTD